MPSSFSFTRLIDSVSNLITEKEVEEKKPTSRQRSHQQEIENSIIVIAAAVIRCDNNFTSETESFFLDFLLKQFGPQGKTYRLKSIVGHLDSGPEPFTKISCQELKMLTTQESRLSIARFLFGLAAADDFVNAKEMRCIHRLSRYLGLGEEEFLELKQAFVNTNSPYVVLGIEESASFEQVKAAYRKMILKYHPDKRRDGISEGEAAVRFREVMRAYEVIKQRQILA